MKMLTFAFLLLAVPEVAVGQTIIFADNFDSGYDDAWQIPDGGWIWDGGVLRNTVTCGNQSCIPGLWCGGVEQSNYIVNFDVCVLSATSPYGTALYVRTMMSAPHDPAEGITSGYAVDIGWSQSGIGEESGGNIHRYDDSVPEYLVLVDNDVRCWFAPGTVYHIKFGKIGDTIVFNKWEMGTPEPNWLMQVADSTYDSGYWYIGFWNGVGWIDNVVVEGEGVIPADPVSWGNLKSMFR